MYLFLACVVGINCFYYIKDPSFDLIQNTSFWIYSVMIVWCFRELAEERKIYHWLNLALKLNILIQLGVYLTGYGRIYYEYWDADRYMGTFNNPNQMAYILFLTILLIYLEDVTYRRKSFWLFFFIDGGLILLTKSTGIFLGWFLLLAGSGCVSLYSRYRDGKISGKLILIVSVSVVSLGIIALVMIWPEKGFVIQEENYNLITRIQEKLALLSDGGIRQVIIDRGGEKLLYYPQYLLYGAGEGGFHRFPLAVVWKSEIHCTIFSVWFSYGLIPFAMLSVWVYKNLRKMNFIYWPVYVALLAESMTVINYRQPFFWLILIYAGMRSMGENDGRSKGKIRAMAEKYMRRR
ncbi:hypothetical protein [Clostridium sp. chh4-2]|uniref:hypothetical protein n=1 Tax=Clostridium sp. chh4-2 TaxID=2067550 RepID=UPI0015E1B47A|nr:hypothetical protein [Clostridium sp. chh4-2]